MPTYTPEQWRRMLKLDELEDRENLPRGTLTAVMRAESGGKSTVVSPAGAGGLFQLMPATADSYKADRFNPEQAADAAAKELGSHYKRYGGDLPRTLAAWNWGSGNVQKHGMANAPAETKGFIPRVLKWITPGSAEAVEPAGPGRQRSAVEAPAGSKWDAMFPGKPPTAAAAPTPPAATPPAATEPPAGSKWDAMFPGAPLPSPSAAPGEAPAQTPIPGAPAGSAVALAPAQGPQPPTAWSTPEQDEAYRISVGQTPMSADTTSSAQEMRGVPAGTTLPAPAGDQPLEETISRAPLEWAATGIEMASGAAGSVAGGAVGGVPGVVGGGMIGQGYGSRLNKRLGLRPQEDYIATGFGMNLYPSDVLNAGFGLLTGGPALFKAALAKTTAGKTIVQAEMTAKEAYQAWQAQRKVLQEAQATGQEAKLQTALKDHATAEANYKRLVQERNDLVAANKAEYDQAVTEYQTTANQAYVKDVGAKQQYLDDLAERQRKQYGSARAETERELLASREAGYNKTLDQIKKEQAAYETKVGERTTALESQAAAIPEARALTEPYKPPEPSHVLYKEYRDTYSNVPLSLDAGKAELKELRASQPKMLGVKGKPRPEPFSGEVEDIARALENAKGANVATIHEQLKKLGPLTRHAEGSIRGPAKKLSGILMDILETAPEAAEAIKAANTAFKREMSLEDINDWLKPRHGVIGYRGGKETINPDALLGKFNKEMADSKLFRDSFTPEEAATIRGNLEALAAKTQPAPPLRAPTAPTPEFLPGASPPPTVTGEMLPAGAYPERFTKGLAGAPERTPLPPAPELAGPPKEVPLIYPEFPAPGKPAGLTVPLEPPAKVPPEPASTSMWYPEARNKGEWLRKAPPKEGQWTREQWETYAQEKLGKQPGFKIGGVLSGAGGMAFALQRMGLSPASADKALYLTAAAGVGGGFARRGEWLLSRALLNDRFRPLLQEAMLDKTTLNPYFYNAMLAALTPAERREMERDTRSTPQKARR